MSLEPPSLIKYAYDQIERDTTLNMLRVGRREALSDLEKGRLIVDFIRKKNEPFANRHFYEHFYEQQDKAEKLSVLEKFTEKI